MSESQSSFSGRRSVGQVKILCLHSFAPRGSPPNITAEAVHQVHIRQHSMSTERRAESMTEKANLMGRCFRFADRRCSYKRTTKKKKKNTNSQKLSTRSPPAPPRKTGFGEPVEALRRYGQKPWGLPLATCLIDGFDRLTKFERGRKHRDFSMCNATATTWYSKRFLCWSPHWRTLRSRARYKGWL